MKDETAQRVGSYAIDKHGVQCLHDYRCAFNGLTVFIRYPSCHVLCSQADGCSYQTYCQHYNLFHKAFIFCFHAAK